MNPETLREMLDGNYSASEVYNAARAAADAWDADIKWRDAMLEYFDVECQALRSKLAKAENELDSLRLFAGPLDQILADDWRMPKSMWPEHWGTGEPIDPVPDDTKPCACGREGSLDHEDFCDNGDDE